MDFDFLTAIEWREGLMAVVVLLTIYIAFVCLRMYRLKREALRAESEPLPFAATSAVAAYSVEQAGSEADEISAQPGGELGSSDFQFPWNEPPAENEAAQRIAALEMEMEQFRREVGGLRAEILVLREAVRRTAVVAPAAPAPEVRQPSVIELIAPQYSEAMQLAQREIDPADISQQCGITRAEAELVAALVRNRDN